MKKYLILASAALLALAACNKEVDIQDPEISNEDVVLTFTSERPQLDVTRTAWDATSKSIVWSAGDKISVGYTLGGAWMGKSSAANLTATPKVSPAFYASNQVSIDAEDACVGTFKVPSSFDFSNSGKAVFYGVFPNSAVGSNTDYAPSLTITLPTSQVPGNNTFDSSADIMIGKSGEITLTDAFPTDPIELDWTRLVAHADLTFSGLNSVDGETVSKITLTFNDEAKVAGSFYVDITNGAITTINGSKNEIVLSGSNLVLSDHNIKAWVSLMPVSFTSLNVVIETNKAYYSRAISASKTFLKNARNVLTIKMADAVRTEKTGQLVADGYYVISYGDYMMTVGEENQSYRGYATKNTTSPTDDAIWKVTYESDDDAYQIQSVGANKFLYGANKSTSSSNLTLGSGDTDLFTIEKSSSEATTYKIAPKGNTSRAIGYNSQNPRFALYTGGTNQPITLDLTSVTVDETPVITISDEERTKTVSASTTSVTFAYVANMFATEAPSVEVSSDENGIIDGTPSVAHGTISVILKANTENKAKTATLSVSGTGIASPITLTINQEAKNGDVFEYTFTSKGWNATREGQSENWTSNKDGNGFSNNGIQVTTGVTGANGTSPYSFTNISEIVVSYCTNGSSGAGSIKVQVGDGTAQTLAVTKTGGTTPRTLSYAFNPKESGNVTITVYCTDNSVYLIGAEITASSINRPDPSIEVSTLTATNTSSTEGTTATLNGKIDLKDGAVLDDVTEAGFYYKADNGTYTKVTVVPATTLTYDLSGLTPSTVTYTYYAYAVYGGNTEIGEEKTFSTISTGNTKTSKLTFTAACGGSGTADDGAEWTVTSDGTESSFDNNKGIHYGTGKVAVQYITLSTSDIPGTITKVVVNASTASGVNATAGVTVDGNAFGGNAQSLTSSAANYTFEGSASGEIVVTVTKPSSANGALYVKSIEVTYQN